MNRDSIGADAGIVWRLLADRGMLSLNEIEEQTNLNPLNLMLAIGWLLKEDKIYLTRDGETLCLELRHEPTDLYY